jgi:hypothetical protein
MMVGIKRREILKMVAAGSSRHTYICKEGRTGFDTPLFYTIA